jgi:hypothetical protein
VTAINAEVALAEGLLLIERYGRGANAANASVPRGAPTLVVLRPTGPDYAGLQPEFTIAAYLPPGPATAAAAATAAGKMHGGGGVGGRVGTPATTTAATTTMAAVPPPLLLFPAPTDDGDFLATRPPATTYVLPFGGFARGGVALANAARLLRQSHRPRDSSREALAWT